MFSYVSSFLENPREMLIFLLLAFPGRILALSAHEYAHAWVADKCGDPTARCLGRLTMNPFRHLDPLGAIMMMLVGFGWAKPVPVNPRNYRNYRKDDLKVSVAGITMNLILFIISYIASCLIVCLALKALPHHATILTAKESMCVTSYKGMRVLITGEYYYEIKGLFQAAPYLADTLITPVWGRLAGYAYQMLGYFVQVNIVLAIFNLLPVPPLDGYHVVNDLLIHKPLFASARTARIASGLLLVLCFSNLLGQGMSIVVNAVFSGLGSALGSLFMTLGLL